MCGWECEENMWGYPCLSVWEHPTLPSAGIANNERVCVCVCVSQTFSPSTSFPLHHLLTYFDPHPAILHANGVRHLIYGGRHHIWPIMQWGLCVWPQSFCSGLRAPDCLRYTWACCRLFLFIAGWTVGMCDMNVYGECKECVSALRCVTVCVGLWCLAESGGAADGRR